MSDNTLFANGKCGAGTNTAAKVGYFGNKVLAVSYGGTLDLKGHKGAVYEGWEADMDPTYSGMSWMRLDDGTHVPNDMVPKSMPEVLFLERDPRDKWQAGDEIVVTTTDYLPTHSEKLQIVNYKGGQIVPFKAIESPTGRIQWQHNGTRWRYSRRPPRSNGQRGCRIASGKALTRISSRTARRHARLWLCSRAASGSSRPATS